MLRTKEEERCLLPWDGGWACDLGWSQYRELPSLELGPCGSPCLAVLLSDVESWKEALPPPTRIPPGCRIEGWGCHGLLLAKVCWGDNIPKPPTPPAWNVK